MAEQKQNKAPSKGGHGHGKSRHGNYAPRFFNNLDENDDGKVTREEFGQAERLQKIEEKTKDKLFERLDKNSDGSLTIKEVRPHGEKFRLEDFGLVLRQADQNEDRKITFEEFSAHQRFSKMEERHQKRLFERLDRNKDGTIDQLDQPERVHAGKFFKEFDTDQSKTLSLEEFLKVPQVREISKQGESKIFSRLDQDESGDISLKEFLKFRRSPKPGSQDGPRRKPRQNQPQRERLER